MNQMEMCDKVYNNKDWWSLVKPKSKDKTHYGPAKRDNGEE